MRAHVTNARLINGSVQSSPYMGVAQWLAPQLHWGCKYPVLRAGELGHLLPLLDAFERASAISMVPAEYEDLTSSTICFTTPRSMRMVLASQSISFDFKPSTSEIRSPKLTAKSSMVRERTSSPRASIRA